MLVIENSKRSTFDNPSSSNRQEQKKHKKQNGAIAAINILSTEVQKRHEAPFYK